MENETQNCHGMKKIPLLEVVTKLGGITEKEEKKISEMSTDHI